MAGALPPVARGRRRGLHLPGDDRRERGRFPLPARRRPSGVLYTENRGFAAANNAGARGSTADILLFLNPDTELARGNLELLVTSLREQPEVGLLAVRQVTSDGRLWPSLHRFPSPRRALAGALGNEQWPRSASGSGSASSTWTATRARAVRLDDGCGARGSPGGIPGRPRVRRAILPLLGGDGPLQAHPGPGLEGRLEPGVTFVHHAGKAGVQPRREAQMAYARLQYARKHFGRRASPPTTRSSSSTTCCGSRSCASAAPPARQAPPPRNSPSAYCSATRIPRFGTSPPGPPPMEARDGG